MRCNSVKHIKESRQSRRLGIEDEQSDFNQMSLQHWEYPFSLSKQRSIALRGKGESWDKKVIQMTVKPKDGGI